MATVAHRVPAMERLQKLLILLLCTSSHPVDHTTLIPTATKALLTGVLDGSARWRPRRKNTVRR
jgi:hypothetical protein